MKKEEMIGLGLVAVPFLCIGSLIGGLVVNKINNDYEKKRTNIWEHTAGIFKDLFMNECEKNDRLKKELEAKKA